MKHTSHTNYEKVARRVLEELMKAGLIRSCVPTTTTWREPRQTPEGELRRVQFYFGPENPDIQIDLRSPEYAIFDWTIQGVLALPMTEFGYRLCKSHLLAPHWVVSEEVKKADLDTAMK
jgi:hypothetical protein